MTQSERLSFIAETPGAAAPYGGAWKILIADDDEEVHKVTKLALSSFTFEGRPLQFLDAYSGRESVEALARDPDIAMVLLDVVMETDSAGLDAVDAIRDRLHNRLVRIVLRTGQPGQAPEHEVVTRYDINDYKEKSELTAAKLFTLLYTGLSQYRDLRALDEGRTGLARVISASARIFEQRRPAPLAKAVLQEWAVLLNLDLAPGHPTDGGLAVSRPAHATPAIVAATGRFDGHAGQPLKQALGRNLLDRILTPPVVGTWRSEADYLCAHFTVHDNRRIAFYVTGAPPLRLPLRQIVDLFCANVAIALENAALNEEIDRTQSELVFMLSEAIEKRSQETGNHVRRVAEYARLLAQLAGLPPEEAEVLFLASPLHDAGKIAIPDAILNKPGRHTPEEKAIMDTHAQLGSEIFRSQGLPVLRAAAIVAGEHHERWDGLGYPRRLKGEDIHIYGRITALADVFDALGSRRCYKQPWPLEDILELVRAERGRHFDPKLVDLFLANLERFLEIRARLGD